MPDQSVISSTGLTLMPECWCRAEAVDQRENCRCRANCYPGIPAFRHLCMIFYIKYNTNSSSIDLQLVSLSTFIKFLKWRNDGLYGICSDRFQNDQKADAGTSPVPKCSDAGLICRMPECQCHFRCPAIPFSERKFRGCAAYIGIGGMKIENEPRH